MWLSAADQWDWTVGLLWGEFLFCLHTAPVMHNFMHQQRSRFCLSRSKGLRTEERSDKGREIVMMEANKMECCLEHLNDPTTYKKLGKDRTNDLRTIVNKKLSDILTLRELNRSLIERLKTPTTARTQRFYGLSKTHKSMLKIRPIVSACRGIFDCLS